MGSLNVDTVLEIVLAGLLATTSALGAAAFWLLRSRKAQHRKALADALALKARGSEELAQLSQSWRSLLRLTRDEIAADVAAQRQRFIAELLPLRASLEEMVRAAPQGHVLTLGLQLVARQLEGVVAGGIVDPTVDVDANADANANADADADADADANADADADADTDANANTDVNTDVNTDAHVAAEAVLVGPEAEES